MIDVHIIQVSAVVEEVLVYAEMGNGILQQLFALDVGLLLGFEKQAEDIAELAL